MEDWTFHSIDNDKVMRRAGMKTRKMAYRKQKQITRLDSMKNIFAKLELSEDMSQVGDIQKSNFIRNTWPSTNKSCDQTMKRRITRRHSFAIESLIRPACAKLEEHTSWSNATSCVLQTDGVTRYQCKPFGAAAVFLGHDVGSGLYYWKGTATITSRLCYVFGHKASGEWIYLTNLFGDLKYRKCDDPPNSIDLETHITDQRVFYYENNNLVSAVQDDYLIDVGTTRGEPSLKLESIHTRSDASKWKF